MEYLKSTLLYTIHPPQPPRPSFPFKNYEKREKTQALILLESINVAP